MTNVIKNQLKKVTLVTLVTVAALAASAQAQTSSGNVNLNVVLKPVRTLVVNSEDVNLVYETADDYLTGKSKTVAGGLTVTNIGSGFKVYAKTTTPNLQGTTGTIDGQTVTVAIEGQTAQQVSDMNSGDGALLLHRDSNNESIINQAYNLVYTAAGNNAYKDKVSRDKTVSETRYTVNVVYTIVSD